MKEGGMRLACAVVLLSACGPSVILDTAHPTFAVQNSGANLFVPVSLNGAAPQFVLLDTGAPQSLWQNLPDDSFVGSLTVGPVTLRDYFVQATQDASIIGFDVLSRFAVTLDYHTPAVTIARTAPAGPIHFSLARSNAVSQLPATTVVVDVVLEGEHHRLALDSGANTVVLRTSVANKWRTDGRLTLASTSTTLYGSTQSHLFRLRSVAVGAASLANVIVGDGAEFLLDTDPSLAIDGLLGGTYLRAFLVTIDYPQRALALTAYADESHIVDEFIRLPLVLARQDNDVVIEETLAGPQAATLAPYVGDVVTSIDGTALGGADDVTISALLHGPVGTVRILDVQGFDLPVEIEDLLAI
jgi:hypothetical protein